MKKTLLTTTAIIAAFAATDANAGNLQVNVGGYADFQAGYVADDITGETGFNADANELNFNTDSEVHISVDGSSDNGLEYGAVLELEAAVADATDTYDNGTQVDKAYLFVQGGWGRVEMGENTGAEEALSVNTGDFASATGGVDGDFYRYISAPAGSATVYADNGAAQTGTTAFNGITKPKLALALNGTGSINGDGADEDATKITYYSPRFSGFQLGASYTPNSGDTTRTGAAAAGITDNEDVFSGGINYANQFDEVGVKASLTALSGSSKNAETNSFIVPATGVAGTTGAGLVTTNPSADLEGYAAGANVSFAGFTVGGSYGDYQDSLGGADANYYDLGLGYTAGAFSVSATYLNSEVGGGTSVVNLGADNAAGGGDDDTIVTGSDFENLVIGADYQLAPGFVPYAEVAFFEADGAGTTAGTNDNEGTVVILGSQLSF